MSRITDKLENIKGAIIADIIEVTGCGLYPAAAVVDNIEDMIDVKIEEAIEGELDE